MTRSSFRGIAGLAWRESRSARRRLLLYMSSISFGVAALVAIDSFSKNVTRSVHEQSRALTGGDILVRARRPFPARTTALLDSIDRAGISIARVTTFPSMAFVRRTGGLRLVQVRAVSAGYPHYGTITSRPADAWRRLHDGPTAVVDPSLLISLNAQIGDTVSLGESAFVISGTLDRVPGELGITAAIGPRVYIPESQLAGTGLLVFGSRAEYEAVAKLPSSMSSATFTRRFSARLTTDSVRVRTAGYNEERLAATIDQLRDFLAIVALIALLLGGVGVASGIHAFVAGKIDTVAILRCVGASSAQVMSIYVSQAVIMGLVGASAGALLGVVAQVVMPRVLKDFLPLDVSTQVEPIAIVLGIGVGVWVALIFALGPLLALRRISPLQALRRDLPAQRGSGRDPASVFVMVGMVASILALAMNRADTMERGLAYSAAIGGALAVLMSAATLLIWLARRLARAGLPFTARQGIAALYRPGNQTRAVVVALGFGVFLIGTLYQIQRNLLRSLDLRLDESRANVVFFDVQDDQRDSVERIIRGSGREIIGVTPIVRMRIDSINGRATGGGGRRGSWATRREYNSTFRAEPAPSEHVTAGTWYPPDPRPGELPEISVEVDVATELGLALGDTIVWNVQGVRLATRVTSFREVKWASFQPNFFVVFQPAALRAAPRQYVILAAAPQPADVAHLQRDIIGSYPTISSIDLTLVQRTVGDVVGKVTSAIRFLAMLSVGLAIPVLFSAVAATRRARVREGVLLKTLGATKRQIGRVLFAEYASLGVLGALAGTLLSIVASWALMRWIFETPFRLAVVPVIIVLVAMAALATAIGFLTGREVFRETPMSALRQP